MMCLFIRAETNVTRFWKTYVKMLHLSLFILKFYLIFFKIECTWNLILA